MDKVEKFKELFSDLEVMVNEFINEYINSDLIIEEESEYRNKIQSKGQELIKLYEKEVNKNE